MKNCLRKILIPFLCVLLLHKCSLIEEDYTNCPDEPDDVSGISFDFSGANTTICNVPDIVDLYIFDEEGILHSIHLDNAIDAVIDCSEMEPGTYQFVAWAWTGDKDAFYSTSPTVAEIGETEIEELLLKLTASGEIVNLPHLFYAYLEAELITGLEPFKLELRQISNTVRVRIEGLPADDNSDYTLKIFDDNSAYEFADGSLINDANVVYAADFEDVGNGVREASLTILQLRNNSAAEMIVYKDGITEISNDLVELILEVFAGNIFEQKCDYEIVFVQDPENGWTLLTLEINENDIDWIPVDVGNEDGGNNTILF